MELDQKKGDLESFLAESKDKMEHLTSIVQSIAEVKTSSNGNDALKRIEAKLDAVADTDFAKYEDLLKALEERQNSLGAKVSSIVDLTDQMVGLLENQSSEQGLVEEIGSLKGEVGNISKEFYRVQDSINYINKQVLELNKNSQQANSVICNLSDKDSVEYLKTALDSLDLNINATLSALSIIDLKIKTVSDNLEYLSSVENVNIIKNTVSRMSETVNTLFEKSKVTTDDISGIKNELNFIVGKFGEVQNNINLSISKFKDNTNEIIKQENSHQASCLNLLKEDTSRIFELVNGLQEDLRTKSSASSIDEVKEDIDFSREEISELIKQENGQQVGSINLLKEDISKISELVDIVREDLLAKSTSKDVACIKGEIDIVNNNISELIKQESSQQADSVNLVKSDMTRLLQEIDVLQEILDTKSSTEDIGVVEAKLNLINERFNEVQENLEFIVSQSDKNQDEMVIQEINSLKDSINGMSGKIEAGSINLIKNDVTSILNKISVLQETLAVEPVIEGVEKIENELNSLGENFSRLIGQKSDEQANNIDLIKNDIEKVSDRFSSLLDVLKTLSTQEDVQNIDGKLSSINSRFGEIQENIDTSVIRIKDGINELLKLETQGNIEQINTSVESVREDLTKLSESFDALRQMAEIASTTGDIHDLRDEIGSMIAEIDVKTEVEELRNLVSDLFLKDDTEPVLQNLGQILIKVDDIESFTRNNFEPKLAKLHDDLCIFQDRISISLSSSLANSISPLNDELVEINQKILDLKENFLFQSDYNKEYKEELATVAERFNDIWTSAGLTIDKLADQVLVTEETTERLQNTVNSFFEVSEDTNLIITNVLKKSSEISNNLAEINKGVEQRIEELTRNVNVESQKIQNTINKESLDVSDRILSAMENDLNFLRADIIEFKDKNEKFLEKNSNAQQDIQSSLSNLHFSITDSTNSFEKTLKNTLEPIKDKQEKLLEDNTASQENILNSLSNLHFSVTDSTNSFEKAVKNEIEAIEERLKELVSDINRLTLSASDSLSGNAEIKNLLKTLQAELGADFAKLVHLSSGTFSNSDAIKGSMVHIAEWIDSAQGLITETNENIKAIRKNNESRKILAEIVLLKENIAKNSNGFGSVSTKMERDILEAKADLKTSLNVIKKRQECDFDSINTGISGISEEISGISQSFTTFETRIKQDLKVLNQSLFEKLDSPKKEISLDGVESAIEQVKRDIGVELRRVNDKFSKMEMNLDSINEKLERLETKQPAGNDNKEIRKMLEFIITQITATPASAASDSSKGGGLVLKKIGSMEKRLAEFDNSLRKVVDFIDSE